MHPADIAKHIPKHYALRMTQLVTRVSDELVAQVDELVSAGVVASRSAAVRQALESLVDDARRRAIGHAIVDGYHRVPQTAEEQEWAAASTRDMLGEDAW